MPINQFFEVSFNRKVIDVREVYKEKDDSIYRGQIFCPECKKVKLFVKGSKKNKKVVDMDNKLHDKNCSYSYTKVHKKQAKDIFNEMDKYKIETKIKNEFKNRYELEKGIGNILVEHDQFNKNKVVNKKTIAIPMINVENLDVKPCEYEQIYFGSAFIVAEKTQRGYAIKLNAVKSRFQYFSLNVNEKTYEHFPKSVKTLFNNEFRPVNFMFYGKLIEDKKKWKTATLKSTNCLIVNPLKKTKE